jgi:hypothetical protein
MLDIRMMKRKLLIPSIPQSMIFVENSATYKLVVADADMGRKLAEANL